MLILNGHSAHCEDIHCSGTSTIKSNIQRFGTNLIKIVSQVT